MAEATKQAHERIISDKEWAEMWAKHGIKWGQRHGPFKIAAGNHIETDPIAVEAASRELTEKAKVEGEVDGQPWNGKPVLFTGTGPSKSPITTLPRCERVYTPKDPPFMSLSNLDRHNPRGADGNYAFAPKFIRFGDAAERMGLDPELLKRPDESLGEFAQRIAKMAGMEESQPAQPNKVPQQQQPARK